MSTSDAESAVGDPDGWYAVRCILVDELAENEASRFRYEERITLWKAESFEEAIRLAESEADEFCADTESERVRLSQAFQLFDPPGHGQEVFSLMRDSDLPPAAYIDRFFDTGAERQTPEP